MTDRPISNLRAYLAGAVLALLVAGCATPPSQQAPAASEPGRPAFAGLARLEYSGSQESLVLLQQAIADAGQDTAKLSAVESELVALLDEPDGTYAGRQAICENLGRLYAISFARGEHAIAPVLVAMLADGTQVDLARAALDHRLVDLGQLAADGDAARFAE